jgi:ring-1,2-phenylacetyl-CoA epoxidase subunit PaaB
MDMPSSTPVFEVFVQVGTERSLEHVGSVRGADAELAWHAAKEAFTRREACTTLWVVPRACVMSGLPSDQLLLRAGTTRRYRVPGFPSRHRRSRSAAVDSAVTP